MLTRRVRIMLITFSMVLLHIAAGAEEEKKKDIFGIIEEPVKMILAPIKGGELVDMITSPAKGILLPLFELGEVSSTAARTKEYVFNVNRNVSVITRDKIKEEEPGYTQRVLAHAPGVVFDGYLGNAKDNNIDIRGFGEAGLENSLVLIDGRRTNQIDLSGPDLSQIDINSIERIEILRGPGTVLYGDNATGGVVNIITRKGEKGDHVEYIQEFGSYRYNKEYVSAEGGHEFLDYFVSGSWQDSNGYRLNGGYEANDLFTSVTVRPAEMFEMDLSSSYHRDWYGQTGALYAGNIQSDGRTGSRYPDSKAKTEDYYFLAEPKLLFERGEHESVISCPVSYRSRRSNSLSVGFNDYEANHHIGSFEMRPKCEVGSSFYEGDVENKLVLGADYFHAVDQVLSGDITFTKSQLNITKDTFGIYATDNIMFEKRYILNGGVRGEWAEYIFDQFQPAMSYDKNRPDEVAFDAGCGYKYNERSQLYANFARSYRYPATDELFQSAYEAFDWSTSSVKVFPAVLNTDLKQQVGNNCEIGIKDNSFDAVNVKADYYFMDNKDEIYYDPIDYRNENYDHTVHHGFELEGKVRPIDMVEVSLAYTFQKAYFVGGKFASKNIPLVPQNKITTNVTVKPVKGLSVSLIIDFVGSQYIGSDQVNDVSQIESHTTVDLVAQHEIGNFRFFGIIRNLLDEKYYSNATKNWQGNPAFYPAPEISFEGGVAVKF